MSEENKSAAEEEVVSQGSRHGADDSPAGAEVPVPTPDADTSPPQEDSHSPGGAGSDHHHSATGRVSSRLEGDPTPPRTSRVGRAPVLMGAFALGFLAVCGLLWLLFLFQEEVVCPVRSCCLGAEVGPVLRSGSVAPNLVIIPLNSFSAGETILTCPLAHLMAVDR